MRGDKAIRSELGQSELSYGQSEYQRGQVEILGPDYCVNIIENIGYNLYIYIMFNEGR